MFKKFVFSYLKQGPKRTTTNLRKFQKFQEIVLTIT